jgi:hypothetical protein
MLMGKDSLFMLTAPNRTSPENAERFCQENLLCPAVHPAYSPDLGSSDFFLFGHIKHCLQGISFLSREEL